MAQWQELPLWYGEIIHCTQRQSGLSNESKVSTVVVHHTRQLGQRQGKIITRWGLAQVHLSALAPRYQREALAPSQSDNFCRLRHRLRLHHHPGLTPVHAMGRDAYFIGPDVVV